jgi:hypothetical protein
MKLEFLDPAQSEFDAAIDCYDGQSLGLGLEFEEEVEQALVRIDHYPRVGRHYHREYAVAFSIDSRTASFRRFEARC